MKIITEIKKTCCFNRFAFLVMSLGLIATFTACSSDDDSDIPVYSLKDVEGNYSGNMLTETAPSRQSTKLFLQRRTAARSHSYR